MKFDGLEGEILEELTSSRLYATKSEAVRSALVLLAVDLNLFERKKLWARIRNYPARERKLETVLNGIQVVKNETTRVY